MTIFESITRSHSLLEQISAHKQINNNDEITTLISSLSAELDTINRLAQHLSKASSSIQAAPAKPELKSGCYIFANEKGFFCPSCYDNHGNKVATTRVNKRLRVCPACRSSIK